MLKKVAFLTILCSLIFMSACKDGYSKKVQHSYDEVMKVHDEVMPEMGTIHKLKKAFKKKLKEDLSKDEKAKFEKHVEDLEFADDSMMDWMHQFKMPKNVGDDKLLEYLADQKTKITKVNEDMKRIINHAKLANE